MVVCYTAICLIRHRSIHKRLRFQCESFQNITSMRHYHQFSDVIPYLWAGYLCFTELVADTTCVAFDLHGLIGLQ